MNRYQRLKDLREDLDINQNQIAEYLETTQQQYSKYETGQQMMGIDKYIKLAKYYNVSIDYLAGLIDRPRPLYQDKTSSYVKNQQNISNVNTVTIHNK